MPTPTLHNADRNLTSNKLENDRPEDLIQILVERFDRTHPHSLELQAETVTEE